MIHKLFLTAVVCGGAMLAMSPSEANAHYGCRRVYRAPVVYSVGYGYAPRYYAPRAVYYGGPRYYGYGPRASFYRGYGGFYYGW